MTLFQEPIEDAGGDRPGIIREVKVTLLHELLGHYFGLDEDELEAWEERIGVR